MKNLLMTFVILVCFGVIIHMSIKYPMESGWYLFSKEGRTQHAAEAARMKTAQEGVAHYLHGSEAKNLNKRWHEEKYQQWKKEEDEWRARQDKEKAFRERYEREKN